MYTISILSKDFDTEKQLLLQEEILAKSGKNFIMEKAEEDFLKYRGNYGITFGVFQDNVLIGEAILYKEPLEEKAEQEDLRDYLWQ